LSGAVPSAGRLAAIAVNTFREAVRQRFFVIVSLATVSFGLAAWWLRDCGVVACREKFLLDAGFGALAFFGAIVAIVATAGSFFGEIERRTVLAVLSRPVRRKEFVLGKLGGILGLLFVFCGMGTALLVGLLWCSRTLPEEQLPGAMLAGERVSLPAVALCGLVQWLRCSVLAALALAVSAYSRSSLLAVVASFAALVVCSLRSFAWDAFASAGHGLAGGAARVLGACVPDFDLYEVADAVANGGAVSPGYLSGIALYSTIYVGMFAAIAACFFWHREL